MSDEQKTWIQHSFYVTLFTFLIHILQFGAALLLWARTPSAVLLSFGLDAFVSAFASVILAIRIERHGRLGIHGMEERWRYRFVAYGYMTAAAVSFYIGVSMLWTGERPAQSIPGIVLAAASMLVIPIIGSYMKTLAVELRSQVLKSAAVFTFGNSYLSMVLLVALLLNAGMDLPWGDPLGALVMFPFMAQKGIQILIEEGKHEYVED